VYIYMHADLFVNIVGAYIYTKEINVIYNDVFRLGLNTIFRTSRLAPAVIDMLLS